jgi:hypothetical protein
VYIVFTIYSYCQNKGIMKTLPTQSIVNGVNIKAIELASTALDAMSICKNNKVKAINTSLYFLTGEGDYSKHIDLKTSASVYLDELIREKN